MSRNKQTIFSMTREMLRQFVSCLGVEGDASTNKKNNYRGASMTPEAYDVRMNSDARKNLQSVQAPR